MKLYIVIVTQLLLIFSDLLNYRYHTEADSNICNPFIEDTIVLYENSINNIQLPFPNKEMFSDIEKAFNGCKVEKELNYDPLDGYESYVYYVMQNGKIIGEFQMFDTDSLNLLSFSSSSVFIKDQYGVRIGDSLSKVKELRNGKFNVFHNYWLPSQMVFECSNILYEITGETETKEGPPVPPTPVDPEMKDWKVARIIWKMSIN